MPVRDHLPTVEDINVYDSLDERHAVRSFLGKGLREAENLFRENFSHYQEDLMWMGPKAFCFYLPAAVHYLLGDDSHGDHNAVREFCMVVGFRLDYDSAEIVSAKPVIRRGILGILDRFEGYEFDPIIDGDVRSRLHALLTRLDGTEERGR